MDRAFGVPESSGIRRVLANFVGRGSGAKPGCWDMPRIAQCRLRSWSPGPPGDARCGVPVSDWAQELSAQPPLKSRDQAIREANDEARTMTLLMRDNEFQQHRTRLAGLEQRFQIGLAQRRDDLNNTPCDKKLHDNKREQSVQGAVLQRLGLRMQNLLEPRAVATDLKSRDPVGLPAAIAAPGILLGGLLSLLVAFGLEFRDQLRIWRERRNSPAFALHWNLRRPPVCRGPC